MKVVVAEVLLGSWTSALRSPKFSLWLRSIVG